jgi:hypothetical protein
VLQTGYAKVPLSFEANVGQSDPAVQFLTHGAGFGAWLTGGGSATFAVPVGGPAQAPGSATPPGPSTFDAFAMQLVGANPDAPAVLEDPLPGRSNYFLGSGPSAAYTDVPTYGQVVYQDVYPGIDLVFQAGPGGGLAYDFLLAPGADPAQIRLRWQGVPSASVDGHGNLVLQTPGGPVVQTMPGVLLPETLAALAC